jgi:glutathione synthase/RimK-type ligase-like ATP-grasp enzyme
MSVGIGIVTISGDAHAYIIASKLKSYKIACHVFEIDQISGARHLSVYSSDGATRVSHSDCFGQPIDLGDLSVCWWRRLARSQAHISDFDDANLRDVVNTACSDAVAAGFLNGFSGAFVSHPVYTRLAENKITQLQAARDVGLRVPRTLISNDAQKIFEFCDTMPMGRVVAKPLGRSARMLDTKLLVRGELEANELVLAPTIFQEYIDGTRHIRANVFGEEVVAVDIVSEKVDWRGHLPDSLTVCALPLDLRSKLVALLNKLHLRMGIIDLKVNMKGEFVFFEINPQGQFLFLEPLTDFPFTKIFAEFLISESLS